MFGKVYKYFIDILRSNDQVTAWLWGIRVHQKCIPFSWDVTTIDLKRAFDELLPEGSFCFLDMGCGHLCLLGQYVKIHRPDAQVLSVDVYPEFVQNAQFNAKKNRLLVDVRQSDLFERVSEKFDLIAFNPPYKSKTGQNKLKYEAIAYSGADGTLVLRQFLKEAHDHLTMKGVVFLGVNCFFITEKLCLEIIAANNYVVEATVRRFLNTARVFILSSKRTSGN